MHIVRYAQGTGPAGIGVLDERGVAPVAAVSGLAELWQLRAADLRALLTAAAAADSRLPVEQVRLLAPVDGRTEVWAAGVTYERSRVARGEESAQNPVYEAVYDADRPELFLKATAWRVVTDGEAAGLRRDAENSVPEPELALMLNRHAEIVGATVCDDLTARGIEGHNPLYLPQAKIYDGACALAARIRPWWEIPDPADLGIRMRVIRDGDTVFSGETSTARLHRSFADLVSWLFRELDLPDGAVLSTGTGIVPPLTDGVLPGDRVEIDIDEVGSLSHVLVTR